MKIDFDESYDVVIIGGGAIGSCLALDTSSRGLKTLLIEQNDFASGSSSKSTKLLHGGVRYLEKAVNELNFKQYSLVNDALNERHNYLHNANHISKKIKILTPIKRSFELPYYYIGLKLYDYISKDKSIGKTSYKNEKELLIQVPSINNEKIKSAVEYYDGSFNDAKLSVNILQSAQFYNAVIKNYTKLNKFIYKKEKLIGLEVFDKIQNQTKKIKASCIINSTGHYVDKIRKLDDENCEELTMFSKGTHLVISKNILNLKEGIIIPKTSDGRVLFVLPWLDYCLIGTTDEACDFIQTTVATDEDKEYLLRHVNEYFNKKIKKEDILSSWSGIRTLIKESSNTKNIVREHIIDISKSNLISICGGKWTTSRKIAQECIDKAIEEKILSCKKPCLTNKIKIFGSFTKKEALKKELFKYNLPKHINKHLLQTYGSNCLEVIYIAQEEKAFDKILENHPYIKAEVLYSLRYEFVKKPMDFLARRSRLAFLNKNDCEKAIESVAKIIKNYSHYDKKTYKKQVEEAKKELNEFF